MPFGPSRTEVTGAEDVTFEPIGDGWAVWADRPVVVEPPTALGIELAFDLRDGTLECIGIRVLDGGPPLTTTLLRRLGPVIHATARSLFPRMVVRLIEHEGEVAGEIPVEPWGDFGTPSGDAYAEHDRRSTGHRGRRPLDREQLELVARLYREAERIKKPRTAYIARRFPNQSPATIRNWVRKARDRGYLEPHESKGVTDG